MLETPEELEPYLDISAEDIARLILCLLIEESLRHRLSAFRHDLPAQPVEGLEEFGVVSPDVVLVRDALR